MEVRSGCKPLSDSKGKPEEGLAKGGSPQREAVVSNAVERQEQDNMEGDLDNFSALLGKEAGQGTG